MLKTILILLCGLCLPLPAQLTGANGMKKGPWKPGDVPKGWKVSDIGRYEFQSNIGDEKVKRVATHLNAMFKVYLEKFPTGRTPSRSFVVKIFRNRDEFLAYGAPPMAAAYYSWQDKEMVGYDTGMIGGVVENHATTKKPEAFEELEALYKMDLLGVFAHEGWHQFFHWYCTSKIPFPSWCDEGIGEYFYPTRLKDGKPELGLPNTYRLATIKSAIRRKTFIPLKDLVTFDQQKYYAVAELAYAEGWSIVHFFMEHPKYRKDRYVSRFVITFSEQHSIQEAVREVFSRMNWEQVEADWKEWVLAQKGVSDELAAKLKKEREKRDAARAKKDEPPEDDPSPESRPDSAPASRPESRPDSRPESDPASRRVG